MKTLHLATITILVLVIYSASTVYAQSSSTVSASLAKVSVGLFNITENSPTIVISGIVYKVFSQNIVLTISNSQNQLISVSQLQPRLDGTFSQSIIPSDHLWPKGNYIVRMTSGSQNLTESIFYFPGIGCCKRIIIPGVQGQLSISNSLLSPLKQFKSSVAANDVKCRQDLQLVIKSEDNSPACVKPDTAQKLIERGWAKLIFETGIAINSYTPISNDTKTESMVSNDTTYLSQTVDEWKNKTPEQLDAYYKKYKDVFYDELGSFLIKDEMKKELEKQDITNIHDDFQVFLGVSLDSLPPHVSYDAVVNATDGNSYLLLGGVFANKIESLKITKLVFDKDVLNSLDSGKILPYTGQFTEDPKAAIQDSDIPWYSIGTGKYGVLEISLYTSVYRMIPDAQKYYTARVHQLIPFYVPVTITTPTFATDGVH